MFHTFSHNKLQIILTSHDAIAAKYMLITKLLRNLDYLGSGLQLKFYKLNRHCYRIVVCT